MSDQGRIFVVGDDEAGDAFGATISMEGVCCKGVRERRLVYNGGWRTLFFNILSLAWLCSFGDCLAEEGEEFANTEQGISRGEGFRTILK